MRFRSSVTSLLWAAASVCVGSGCSSVDEGPETRPVGEPVLSAAQLREAQVSIDFQRHIQPVLERRCLQCHDGKTLLGGYSLATREEAFQEGSKGPRIVPGHAERSLLFVSISTGNHALSMPSVGIQVAKEEVEALRRWIDAGATWPEGLRLRARW
ncbi:MAG TPA: c-type cytochrome domain-containing protein [Verrucomicrobiales bacterium]|nr:c-type cytochrome domain-containing protein [Verrucomicrobiales bacterium]